MAVGPDAGHDVKQADVGLIIIYRVTKQEKMNNCYPKWKTLPWHTAGDG